MNLKSLEAEKAFQNVWLFGSIDDQLSFVHKVLKITGDSKMNVNDAGEIPEVQDGQQTQSLVGATQSCMSLCSLSVLLLNLLVPWIFNV